MKVLRFACAHVKQQWLVAENNNVNKVYNFSWTTIAVICMQVYCEGLTNGGDNDYHNVILAT